MTDQVVSFYDSMAEYYHLIFEDWTQSIHRQARVLGPLISRQMSSHHLKILDCACGIGTQALGFAALGHHVVASDLSPAEVARAKREAQNRGLDIEFYVSNVTDLKEIPETQFDVVAAFDNAFPHLTSVQLARAIEAIAARLNSGGLFVASIRDYDLLLRQRPAMQEPSFFGREGSRRIVYQIWDWTEATKYVLHQYIAIEAGKEWRTHHFTSEYRCIRRRELSDALRSVGFEEPVWLLPAESGYYQPLVQARLP